MTPVFSSTVRHRLSRVTTAIPAEWAAFEKHEQQEKRGDLIMASKKAGLTDAQADAIAAVIIVATVVAAAIYWVATAG